MQETVAVPEPMTAPSAPVTIPMPGLKTAFNTYKLKFSSLIKVAILPVLISLIFGPLLSEKGLFGFSLADDSLSAAIRIPLIIVVYLIAIIVPMWCQLALISVVAGESNIKGAFQKNRGKILSLYWISILEGFMVLGGVLLLLIPGIILLIWFSLAQFVLVVENTRGMNALLKSREYIKGAFWPVVKYQLILGVLAIIFIIPLLLLDALIGAQAISTILIWTALTPFAFIYVFNLYSYLKSVKGEVPSSFSSGRKFLFLLYGIFWIILLPAMIYIAINPRGSNIPQGYNRNNINQPMAPPSYKLNEI